VLKDSLPFLTELRKRLLLCVLVIGVIFIGFAFYANDVYRVFAFPLLKHFPAASPLIATSVPSPFLVPFKSALVAAIYVAAPFWLFQLWRFIAPALYSHERRLVTGLTLLSTLLFYAGTLFSYFVVLPLLFKFFIGVAPAGVEVRPDIGLYLSFMLRLLLVFGLAFQVPIVTFVLIRTGIVSYQTLASKRAYIVVGAFVLGMLLTPPDVISQIILAAPLWFLFECGLLLARLLPAKVRLGEARE